MTSIQIDIKDGLSSSTAIKGPCRVATTANITLVGEQTIDGVAVVTDDRVLVKDQTTASDNGIYIVDTGNWRRSKDFNKTKDVKKGSLISVTDGTVGSGIWQLSTADPITIGTTSIAFTLVSNAALAGTIPGATGLQLLAAATQAAAWAIVASASAFAQPTLTGKFWTADGARIHRMSDRVLIDAAARDFNGNRAESGSYVSASPFNSGYLDRAASFASYSSKGGVGGAFASRASDQYTQFPNYGVAGATPTPWVSGATGVLGTRVAYQGRVYDVTVGGVFSSTAPSHTTGSAANGAATLTFVDYTYMVPIAGSFFAIQDSDDQGTAVWAGYFETVSTTSAPSYAMEVAVKNRSSTNPTTNPYSIFSTAMGIGFAGGGDPNVSSATNPSSHAILIYKNATTWNTGIVFDANGITGTDGVTGYGIAVKLAKGHVIEWDYTGGNIGFSLVSDVNASTDAQTLNINTAGFNFLNNSSLAGFRVAKTAGTLTGNIVVSASTSAAPFMASEGSATNVAFNFQTKGTGTYSFYTNSTVKQFEIGHVASAVNFIGAAGAVTTAAPFLYAAGNDTNIGFGYATKGTGAHSFLTNGSIKQFEVGHTASAVNYFSVTGSATGVALSVAAAGADTNIGVGYATKGTGVHSFYTNAATKQLEVAHIASAVNYLQLQGSVTTSPLLVQAAGSDTNISMVFIPKGSGTTFFRNQGLNTFQIDGPSSSVNRLAVIAAVTTGSPMLYTTGSDTNISGQLQGTGTGGWKFLDGAGAKKIEYNTTGVGFFAATPVVKQTVGAALSTGGAETNTNLATRINEIRTALINYGLAA